MLVAARRDAMGSSTARACHARTWRSTPSHRLSGISTAVAVAIPKRHAVSLSTPVHSILTERRLLHPAPTTFSEQLNSLHLVKPRRPARLRNDDAQRGGTEMNMSGK